MSGTTLTIEQLARLDRDAFIAALGDLFEHAAWVAEGAWPRRPFTSVAELHEVMMAVVRGAPLARQIDFLRGHPELAGKDAIAGTMTDHSTLEQSGAGLNALSRAELTELQRLNAAYLARHGFPFIIKVLAHNKPQIFEALRRRAANDTADEREEALRQIAAITWRRIAARFSASENAVKTSPH